jgi:GTP-binding protein Era
VTVNKSGFAAIIGRPNVGKSTLLNALLGEKISIISPKPQTTRWQVMGIKIVDDAQIIFVDTPGINREQKRAMNRYLNRIASSVLKDADVILFLVDALSWRGEDEMVLDILKHTDKPVILVINKIDLVKDKGELLPVINKLKEKYPFQHIVPISALDADNLAALETEIIQFLPQGPMLFPEDQITDKSLRFQIAELIREKIIQNTEEEIPYAVSVEIEELKQEPELTTIHAVIWVERQGQKIIVIGKNGERLKKIGTAARRDIERLTGNKVFVRLWVKIKENWTDDDRTLRSFGYE